jgi:uncharacterized BrkB/YihY/UPF0761 family membrane protein
MKMRIVPPMEMLDGLVPEVIQRASDWIEDRYGRFAGRIAFVGLLLAVPLLALVVMVGFLTLQRG